MESTAASPNIILITSDHHRFDYMGCAGAAFVHTPNLDRLAARGTMIDRAYCNAPLCVPSRIAITTGRYAMNTGCFTNRQPIDLHTPTFVHQLRGGGYHTAMIGKLHHHVHAWDADFIAHEPDIHALGFEHVHETSGKQGSGEIGCECQYVRYLRGIGMLDNYRSWVGRFRKGNATMRPNEPWPWADVLTQDAYIASKACEFVGQVSVKSPFYLHLGFVGPHNPYDAPQLYRDMVPSDPALRPLPAGADSSPEVGSKKAEPLQASTSASQQAVLSQQDRTTSEATVAYDPWLAYVACITEIDAKVGQVMDALEARQMLGNTVILYTSDHGDCAGDHGRWGKINLYEGSVHVPFIASGPGIQLGKRSGAIAELIDIGATVCDFAGCSSHLFDQGISLKPLLTGETEQHREDAYCEMGSDKMLYDGTYKLMYGDLTRDTRKHLQAFPMHGPAFGRPVNIPPDQISLYDLTADPYEERNLEGDPAYAGVLSMMKEKLLNRLICNMQSVPDDSGSVL
jgi:arylsulfatase